MKIKSKYIKPKFKKKYNPKVGLLALSTDLTIEKDFNIAKKKVAKDIKLPGFRKGKVPENILMSQFHHQRN